MVQLCAVKKIKVIRTDNVISSARFPLRDGEVLDLSAALVDLKDAFSRREVFLNERFFLLCLKLENATVNVSYKGKLKFFSVLPERELERICFDLWADFFKKNVVVKIEGEDKWRW